MKTFTVTEQEGDKFLKEESRKLRQSDFKKVPEGEALTEECTEHLASLQTIPIAKQYSDYWKVGDSVKEDELLFEWEQAKPEDIKTGRLVYFYGHTYRVRENQWDGKWLMVAGYELGIHELKTPKFAMPKPKESESIEEFIKAAFQILVGKGNQAMHKYIVESQFSITKKQLP